jgi:hypothetical protein
VAGQFHLGSTLRFSQPLSGFLAGSSFAALFHAVTVVGIPPFRVFPSQEIACLSRGRLTSMQLSTDVLERTARFLSPPVSPTSTLSRGCLVPHTAMSFLFTRLHALPGRSGTRAVEPSLSVSFTCFEAMSLPRVRLQPGWVSPHQLIDTLLGFCPSRAFSLHASDPQPAWTHRVQTRALLPKIPGSRHEGPQPLLPGETVPTQ